MKKKILIPVCLILAAPANAQLIPPERSARPGIEIMAKSFLDSVIIRWAPTSSDLWLAGNQEGYRLIRKTVGIGDSFFISQPIVEELSLLPFKPMPLEQTESIIHEDLYAGVVAQAIYGEKFEVVTRNPESLLNKAKEIENRYSMALFASDISRKAAEVHGLIYTDRNVIKNAHYLYTVLLATESPAIDYDTGHVYVQVADTFPLPGPIDVKAIRGDKLITVKWRKKIYDNIYSAYIIERSTDGEKFEQRNRNPMVTLMQSEDQDAEYNLFVDSIPNNDNDFIYRIKGISPLGITGPPSDTIHVRGTKALYMLNPMVSKTNIRNDGSVKIEWEVPYPDSIHLNRFNIYRSQQAENNYSLISGKVELSKDTRSFIDQNPFSTGYYIIEAIDELNRAYRSFPAMVLLPDSIPPVAPELLKGVCDSSGIIHLTWKANHESDLAGYKVFRYNNPADNPMKISHSELSENEYFDTISLRTLTKSVYYSVAAYDWHFNQSPYSSIVEVFLVDTIAPPVVTFSDYSVSEGRIRLLWNRSPANDVYAYLVYRSEYPSGNWVLVSKDTLKNLSFTDSTYKQQENNYLITCLDRSGNESEPSRILSVSGVNSTIILSPEIKLKMTGHNSLQIIFSSKRNDISKILIYRSMNESRYTLFKTVFDVQEKIVDQNLKIGNSYAYRLQFIYADGKKSALSEPVTAKM